MKCEEFLPAIATGGIIRRTRAALHAARCPRCAVARARFAEARRDWADPPAPTDAHRAAWARVARAETRAATPKFPLAARRALAAVACVVIGGAIFYVARSSRPDQREIVQAPRPVPAPTPPGARMVEPQTELEEIERGLDRLAAELGDLERLAAMLDVRRDADTLLAMYKPLGVPPKSQSRVN